MLSRPRNRGNEARFLAWRVQRHVSKMRQQGLLSVARDDLQRSAVHARKFRWRLTHDCRPNATPIFIIGLQRSGTKMLIFGLNQSPEVRIYNESKRSPAFVDFQLRDEEVIRSLVEQSPHVSVVFKALCDSHRAPDLLDGLGTPSRGKAIWIYRSMEARVRSAVARFGDNNLRVLSALAAGRGESSWQAGGLTPRLRELIEQFDYDSMSPASAAALWWYVRNSLFFDLRLNERADIALTSYDRFVLDPEGMMRSVSSFAGVSYSPRMISGISARPAPSVGDLEIDDRVRTLCTELEGRLDGWFETHGARPPATAAA